MKKLISLFAVIAMLTAAVAPVFAGDLPYSQDAVDAAIAAIDAIGEVDDSFECEERIINAENAYAMLSNDERAAVTNYDVLVAAREAYNALTVIDDGPIHAIWLIDQIGEVEYTDECLARITEAEEMINALSDAQLAQVTNYDVFLAAKARYEELRPVVAGDADGDGVLNALDVRLLMRFIIGYDVEIDRKAADFNGDGKFNNRDVLMMLLAIVNG